MSGAAFVIGLISGIISIGVISIVDGIKTVYDAAQDATGQPDAFRQVAARLPLVIKILESAKARAQSLDETAQEALEPTLKSCKVKAENLQEIFHKVVRKDDDKWYDRYIKAVKGALGKQSHVEGLMEGILKDVYLLVSEKLMGTATEAEVEEIKEAMKEMKDMPSSLQDETADVLQQQHWGSGDNNAAIGGGVFNLHKGTGDQHHAVVHGDATIGDNSPYATFNITIHRYDSPQLVDTVKKYKQGLSDTEYRRCLDNLQSLDPRHDKTRIEDDKDGLLRDSYCWVLDDPQFKKWIDGDFGQLLWIKGEPGKGKTMLLCGIIDELPKIITRDTNISFFFCQATNTRINNATAVLRGLIYMLVKKQRSLIKHIQDGNFDGENAWTALREAFMNILKDPTLNETYLIIDALDECSVGLENLLRLLVQKPSTHQRVKWVVSSRKLPDIGEHLTGKVQSELCLELNEETVSAAVGSFIDHRLNELAERKNYSSAIQNDVKRYLSSNAHGTFLWVALVCKELAGIAKGYVQDTFKEYPPSLDKLYERMFDQISNCYDAKLCKFVLSVILSVYRPITLDELVTCIDLPVGVRENQALKDMIGRCGSFLTLRGRTISLIHQSAKDFLLREACVRTFPHAIEMVHYSIFSVSLRAIHKALRLDIYNLARPGYSIDQIKQPDTDPLAGVQYACAFWVNHLNDCSPNKNATKDLTGSGAVSNFFCQDYTHWLEALSLLKCVSKGVDSMLILKRLLEETEEASNMTQKVEDAYRFILYFKIVIENHPLQVYASGLVFSPGKTLTRIQFEGQMPQWITRKPITEEGWTACLQTLEGHTDSVSSVVFSHDSKLLASASGDHTVRLWDTNRGQCLKTLEGHSDSVRSVVSSHDSEVLASASRDHTIKMWDISSSQCLKSLEGHNDSVDSISFSHDSKLLASASNDHTIKLWDTTSSQCLRTIKAHPTGILWVDFSHDSKLIASASADETIKLWDTSSGVCLGILEGHIHHVTSVDFSHDSSLLASASGDSMVKVWNTRSGRCLKTLGGHEGVVFSVAFSCDSNLLASGSSNGIVKIWTISSGQCLQTIEGHSLGVYSVAFSHDSQILASASGDGTIKIWDTSRDRNQSPRILERHSSSVTSLVLSHDCKVLASTSTDHTIKLWDISRRKCLQTLEGHSDSVTSVIFSPDAALLASSSDDGNIKIWDISSSDNQCRQTLGGHFDFVTLFIFSPDSKLLASIPGYDTIMIWDTSSDSGCSLQTLGGHGGGIGLLIFSPNSKFLAAALDNGTIAIWNVASGSDSCQCPRILEGHSGSVNSIVFSHDSNLLASASPDCTVKIWDSDDCKCLHTFNLEQVASVLSFNDDSSYLETDTYIICLSPDLGTLTTNVSPKMTQCGGYGISSDSSWITWNSENVLWLPPDYRPTASAVSSSHVFLGCFSGHLLFFNFDTPKLQDVISGH